MTCIAFYADCHHEVKPVTEGYRLALTYNLILTESTPSSYPPSASTSFTHAARLRDSLKDYFTPNNSETVTRPEKFVYLLDHDYTAKGLSWRHLKNIDRLRAEALRDAAKTLGLTVHLALADIQETWDTDGGDDYYYSSRRRRRHYYYDDDEDYGHEEGDNVEVTDLISSETVLKHWRDVNDKPVKYKDFYLSSSYIGWTKATEALTPFKSEYEGFMGNYGNTMDRWYHRAAIVLWRQEDDYAVQFEVDAAKLLQKLAGMTRYKNRQETLQQILLSLLPYWQSTFRRMTVSSQVISHVLKLAIYIQTAKLSTSLLHDFNISALTPTTVALLLSLEKAYGTTWCLNVLSTWIDEKKFSCYSPDHCQDFLAIMQALIAQQPAHQPFSDWLLDYQLNCLKVLDQTSGKNSTRAEQYRGAKARIGLMVEFLSSSQLAGNHALHQQALQQMMGYPMLYPPLECVAFVLACQEKYSSRQFSEWGYDKLLEMIKQALQAEYQCGLRQADDWSIEDTPTCDCEDCRHCIDFLRAGHLKTLIWPLSKPRRRHIHDQLNNMAVPVTHETKRTGSPHKLILTKTNRLHTQAKTRFKQVEKALKQLAK